MGSLNTLSPAVLTIGAYTAFAPVAWAENGVARGKDIEFLRAFARQVGLETRVRFFDFDRIWERPLTGEVDIAAAGIAPFDRRRASGITWSIPYHTVQRSLLVRAEERHALRTMSDFAGKTIAVTRGSTADLDTRRRKPASTRVVYFHQQEAAVEALLNWRIDAFGTGDICSHHVSEQNAGRLAVTDVHRMEEPEYFSFAVAEKSELAAPLDEFIRKNGERYPDVPATCEWSDYQI